MGKGDYSIYVQVVCAQDKGFCFLFTFVLESLAITLWLGKKSKKNLKRKHTYAII